MERNEFVRVSLENAGRKLSFNTVLYSRTKQAIIDTCIVMKRQIRDVLFERLQYNALSGSYSELTSDAFEMRKSEVEFAQDRRAQK